MNAADFKTEVIQLVQRWNAATAQYPQSATPSLLAELNKLIEPVQCWCGRPQEDHCREVTDPYSCPGSKPRNAKPPSPPPITWGIKDLPNIPAGTRIEFEFPQAQTMYRLKWQRRIQHSSDPLCWFDECEYLDDPRTAKNGYDRLKEELFIPERDLKCKECKGKGLNSISALNNNCKCDTCRCHYCNGTGILPDQFIDGHCVRNLTLETAQVVWTPAQFDANGILHNPARIVCRRASGEPL